MLHPTEENVSWEDAKSGEIIFTLSSYQIQHLTILLINLTIRQVFFTSEGGFGIVYELEGSIRREIISRERPEDSITLSL